MLTNLPFITQNDHKNLNNSCTDSYAIHVANNSQARLALLLHTLFKTQERITNFESSAPSIAKILNSLICTQGAGTPWYSNSLGSRRPTT